MAHCPYEKLADIAPVFAEIRELEDVREAKPGIFYLKSNGFLHFHIDKAGNRWADVKTRPRGDWAKIPLSAKVTKAQCRAFVAAVKKHHKSYLSG